MKPLYEISNEYALFVQEALECEELTGEQLQKLEELQDSIENKAINTAAFIKNLEVEKNAIDEARKKMEERANKIDTKINYLKSYLKYNLEKNNINKVTSAYYDITIRKNPSSVNIMEPEKIPEKYLKIVTTQRIDKTLIAQDLKNNIEVPGAGFINGTRLEIK